MVDEVYLGHDDDMYTIVQEIKPDIIALGFDQIHNDATIKNELKKRKLNVKLVRLPKYEGGSDLDGTRRIIQKVIAAHEFQKKMQRIEGKT
jgi:FAD synthetase